MERMHISYLLIALLVLLCTLIVGIFVQELRKGSQGRREHADKLALEHQLARDRENTFRERHGPKY